MAYTFPATVVRVKDGDTFVARILVAEAFHETWEQTRVWRLNGCNARESRDPTGGGRAATEHLRELLPVGARVIVHSIKVDPYTDDQTEAARYEASVTLADGSDLVTQLIATGWAAPWNGVTQPRPLPPWPRTTEETP
jgi:endonuclease YncB( thermonuclease family)